MSNILVIDDEIDIRESIVAILSDEGFLCDNASNSKEAIHLIGINNYDLIILDVWLNDPDYDGMKLLKLIKKEMLKFQSLLFQAMEILIWRLKQLKKVRTNLWKNLLKVKD